MGSMEFTVTGEFDAWLDGFKELSRGPSFEMEQRFERAAEFWYDESQFYVHVVTGRLKASGEVEVEKRGSRLFATLMYDTPYAIYEYERGGDHAWFDLAWATSEGEFQQALVDGWAETVESWK